MRIEDAGGFRCPRSGGALRLAEAVQRDGELVSGKLLSPDGSVFPIENGIPNFVAPELLTPMEAQVKAEYDRVSQEIYDVAMDWQFAALYEDENAVRETMVDMLGLTPEAKVLEVGCGTGRDSFRLARRLGPHGRLHMQDLSAGMVHSCVRKMSEISAASRFACGLEYSISNALSLPFPDGAFDAVFHFGGFNQFGDLAAGAAELTRVAKPGGRILIGDEAVAPWLRGTEFEAIVTTNNPLFKAHAPLHVLPSGAREVTVRWIMGNCFYVISFRKGEGPPPLHLDLPHKGWRGGTMRTRYFGVVDVTLEAKALARKAAQHAGLSVHEWIDRVVRAEAASVLGKPGTGKASGSS